MKFEKKGIICDASSIGVSWFKKNAMVPLPYLKDAATIRVFMTMCDEKNVGRIGYIDVDADNPSCIKGYSQKPVLDIGMPGTYDDNGVVSSSLLCENGKMYMYFSGYELSTKIPYKIFCGVAVSEDNGLSFKRLNYASILPPIDNELFNRCAPYVIKTKNGYRMFYLGDAGNQWRVDRNGHKVPMYTLKTLCSDNLLRWPLEEGALVMPFQTDDECGITLPNIWKEDDVFKMIYSIRRVNSGYILGYAESKDGIFFDRQDEKLEFEGAQAQWDSEMMCFAKLITVHDRTYMFYCGNHYGRGGMGWAELIR